MTYAQFFKKHDMDRWQAIVKTLDDKRRMLIGFERKSKRSTGYKVKMLINPPIALDEVVAAHKQAKAEAQSELATAKT